MIVTRFAPSPSGYLHLGHAFSALTAHDFARSHDGRFLLRIEDIDSTRCRQKFTNAIFEDLTWLGIAWDGPVRHQSAYLSDYKAALDRLWRMGVLYPCFCSRRDITEEIVRAGGAPHGPEGALYPGLCRGLDRNVSCLDELTTGSKDFALRLDVSHAMSKIGPLHWIEDGVGEHTARPDALGDSVLARKDIGTSYHLSVVVDDALQGVTHVIRGEDLRHATCMHRLLQELLGLPAPRYRFHPLLTDMNGNRLAKRDKAMTLHSLRKAGYSPKAVRAMAIPLPRTG
ncbi:MAG: tRNA glutamyl-Q(34) synthetase GluQRS [Pseudomonadota bacterium]|nr:tRNA glutamyl-Q(34) synthetase GluQRS [Pseudomonadota bacterium]